MAASTASTSASRSPTRMARSSRRCEARTTDASCTPWAWGTRGSAATPRFGFARRLVEGWGRSVGARKSRIGCVRRPTSTRTLHATHDMPLRGGTGPDEPERHFAYISHGASGFVGSCGGEVPVRLRAVRHVEIRRPVGTPGRASHFS
eukprot:6543286-Prymnesium_polylepis.2